MAACSLPLPELTCFLSPQTTAKRRLSLSKLSLTRYQRHGVRAAVEERERESELIRKVNGVSTNGNYSNGSVRVIESSDNEMLVKYVNGNGAAATAVVDVREVNKAKEEGRQRKIEEIGKEDAWFKKNSDLPKVEVSVAPGGRWSRFKTYSTIQRTLEIWGFVFTFLIKAWWNSKKFAYRG